jgi:hypothetical protein
LISDEKFSVEIGAIVASFSVRCLRRLHPPLFLMLSQRLFLMLVLEHARRRLAPSALTMAASIPTTRFVMLSR